MKRPQRPPRPLAPPALSNRLRKSALGVFACFAGLIWLGLAGGGRPAMCQSRGRDLPSPADAKRQADEEARAAEMRHPKELAAKAFAPPPGTRSLSKNTNLWVDLKRRRVYADGYVAMREGPLEMFACPTGTKEHESVVATLAKANEVHASLLAVGAEPGTPVRFNPEFVPPTGQQIRVWVTWQDMGGKFQVTDARQWIRNVKTKEPMQPEWVFSGSGFWKDPVDGREYYQADSGDMICVSNFSTAMMDLPFASSADAGSLLFEPITERIPEVGTPVRLVLVPLPIPRDEPQPGAEREAKQPPTAKILPGPNKDADPATAARSSKQPTEVASDADGESDGGGDGDGSAASSP